MIEIKRYFRPDRGFENVEQLNGYIFSPEAQAHTFIISQLVLVAGVETPAEFQSTATVSCRFLKHNQVTELVEGSIVNGKAVVTLPAECYAVPGRFTMTILLTKDSSVTCIYAAAGSVLDADSENVNVSQNTVRNVDEKIAEINSASATAQAAVSQVQAAVAGVPAVIASIPQDYTALSNSVGDLKSAIASLDDGISIVDKNITWTNAWVNVNGKLVSSSASKTGLFEMQAGETLTVGTKNPNITIIGSTTSSSISVGDTITVIQTTSSTNQYEEYSYTATGPINIVVCVLAANYNISVTKTSNIQTQINSANTRIDELKGKYTFSFQNNSGSAHSSSSDKISLDIPHNHPCTINVSLNITPSGTFELWAVYSDNTSENLVTGYFDKVYTFMPPKIIKQFGIAIGQQSGAYTCTIKLDTNGTTGITELNDFGYNALLQAKRPINTTANAYLSAVQPLVLFHFSDIHGGAENLRRIVAFRDKYADLIDDTICTGDMVTDRFSSGMSFWDAVPGSDDIMMIIGNHDALAAASGYDWTDLKSQADQYGRYIAPYVSNWDCEYTENKTYYYKDYASKKVRLICLNCMLTGDDNTAQLTWFANTLSGAITNDYYVIVAVHYPISNHTTVSCGFSSIDKIPHQTQDRLSDDYMSAVNTFIGNGGKFGCYITGHTHTDFILKSSNYNGQLCVVIDSASYSAGNSDSDTQRTIATKSYDCANLFVFDSASGAIKIIRVGADMDHYMRPKNDITFKLSDLSIITQS